MKELVYMDDGYPESADYDSNYNVVEVDPLPCARTTQSPVSPTRIPVPLSSCYRNLRIGSTRTACRCSRRVLDCA